MKLMAKIITDADSHEICWWKQKNQIYNNNNKTKFYVLDINISYKFIDDYNTFPV